MGTMYPGSDPVHFHRRRCDQQDDMRSLPPGFQRLLLVPFDPDPVTWLEGVQLVWGWLEPGLEARPQLLMHLGERKNKISKMRGYLIRGWGGWQDGGQRAIENLVGGKG